MTPTNISPTPTNGAAADCTAWMAPATTPPGAAARWSDTRALADDLVP